MAGMAGFEPTNDGVKVRCLTAWLHPIEWLGWLDSDQRMMGSEPIALPLGDNPTGVDNRD